MARERKAARGHRDTFQPTPVPVAAEICPKRAKLVDSILAKPWLESERPDADVDPIHLKRPKPKKKKKPRK